MFFIFHVFKGHDYSNTRGKVRMDRNGHFLTKKGMYIRTQRSLGGTRKRGNKYRICYTFDQKREQQQKATVFDKKRALTDCPWAELAGTCSTKRDRMPHFSIKKGSVAFCKRSYPGIAGHGERRQPWPVFRVLTNRGKRV